MKKKMNDYKKTNTQLSLFPSLGIELAQYAHRVRSEAVKRGLAREKMARMS